MLLTFVTSMILLVSVLLVVSNLGSVADDTAKAMRGVMLRLRMQGRTAPMVAFVMLWATIFGLGFL